MAIKPSTKPIPPAMRSFDGLKYVGPSIFGHWWRKPNGRLTLRTLDEKGLVEHLTGVK
jgi:hypothetical protein